MPGQETFVRFTRAAGGLPLDLPGADSIDRDPAGNVTFTWRDPLAASGDARLVVGDVDGYLSTGVDVQKNRLGTVQATTDAGGSLLTVEWSEVDPWAGVVRGPYSLIGVAALANARASRLEDGLTIVVYRAHYRHERGTGVTESA